MAPGVSILVPRLGGGYWYDSGTSFATPIAAGVLTLAWSAAPSMTPDQALNVLYQSCDPLEPVTEFNSTGWGRVNAGNAVQRGTGRSAEGAGQRQLPAPGGNPARSMKIWDPREKAEKACRQMAMACREGHSDHRPLRDSCPSMSS